MRVNFDTFKFIKILCLTGTEQKKGRGEAHSIQKEGGGGGWGGWP